MLSVNWVVNNLLLSNKSDQCKLSTDFATSTFLLSNFSLLECSRLVCRVPHCPRGNKKAPGTRLIRRTKVREKEATAYLTNVACQVPFYCNRSSFKFVNNHLLIMSTIDVPLSFL